MNPIESAVLALALAAAPARAQFGDADFSGQLGRAGALIRQEKALRRGFVLATQESGPNDPLLLMQAPLIALIKKVEPSTVFLRISGSTSPADGAGAAPKDRAQICSGFFVDGAPYLRRAGLIATNSHCVERKAVGDEILIGLYAGSADRPRMVKGRVLAYGSSRAAKDVAFVELQDQSLNRPPLPLWDKLDVGEEVVAIGAPRGLTFTVTRGIVSALDRERVESQFVLSSDQTDAAVNPGNSGGPLFNMWGSVVGVNTMLLSSANGSEGLNFTVPARYVAMALRQYARTGDLKPGSLQLTAAPDEDAKKLLVLKVRPGGPAAGAGVLVGDELVRVDDVDLAALDPADAMREFLGRVKYTSPGEFVSLVVRRDGRLVAISVAVGEPAASESSPKPAPKQDSSEP
jgi:S1-C subfamily serine protease